MALSDYPDLQDVFETLQAEKDVLREQSAELWERYNALRAEIAPLEDELRDVAKQIQAIERPRLAQIDNQMAAIARSCGGLTMSGT